MKKNIDKENLREVILDSWNQFQAGIDLAKDIRIGGNFQSVCVSGMGGSSLPTDVVKTYVSHLRQKDSKKNKNFRILKNRNYTLPIEAYENCLNLFVSYSGNTEETLSSLEEAIEKNLPSIGISHGGKLSEICEKNKIPHITIPSISQPRYALGYIFSITVTLLSNLKLLENTSDEMIRSAIILKETTSRLERKGKALSEKIFKKTPIIHTPESLKSVGRVWKIKINENSKTPCFFNYYPELNHNEMVGFTLPQAKFHFITLAGKKDHPQIVKRMKITSKLLAKNKNLSTSLIEIPNEENIFMAVFSALALGDWVSYYLALLYKQDPTPVEMVEDLKKKLA
jgi:glucose/mannose-6-phosphate isomerase